MKNMNYELAQYKIVTTAPYVNFCSLKDFFVSSSGFFVANFSALLLTVLQIHNLVVDRLNFTEKSRASRVREFFYALCFFL